MRGARPFALRDERFIVGRKSDKQRKRWVDPMLAAAATYEPTGTAMFDLPPAESWLSLAYSNHCDVSTPQL